jgi:hypothetical protein
MVERTSKLEMNKLQLDMLGTPMPPKTPLNLQKRLEEIRKSNSGAQKQLYLASFVSLFFIIA